MRCLFQNVIHRWIIIFFGVDLTNIVVKKTHIIYSVIKELMRCA
ncbi:hypothetical protein BN1325_60062 [Staphylococcus aureus]|nr:hypothetical protein SAET23_70060 [Staphylococcus aureus]CRI30072.1 hypothetical protein BN1325_60062 [Staphylococcus aureus]CRI30282.1 hypothetical protein SAET23_70060 [Staphylococcus aureus]CRI31849.1 hypothetical protein BN1325_60062 [Staphylococcus aureus]